MDSVSRSWARPPVATTTARPAPRCAACQALRVGADPGARLDDHTAGVDGCAHARPLATDLGCRVRALDEKRRAAPDCEPDLSGPSGPPRQTCRTTARERSGACSPTRGSALFRGACLQVEEEPGIESGGSEEIHLARQDVGPEIHVGPVGVMVVLEVLDDWAVVRLTQEESSPGAAVADEEVWVRSEAAPHVL